MPPQEGSQSFEAVVIGQAKGRMLSRHDPKHFTDATGTGAAVLFTDTGAALLSQVRRGQKIGGAGGRGQGTHWLVIIFKAFVLPHQP